MCKQCRTLLQAVLFLGLGRELALRHTDTKTKRTTFQSSVLLCDLAEREGLATTLPMVAPFNAFPFCSPQGPLQAHCAKSSKLYLLFYMPLSTSKVCDNQRKNQEKVEDSSYNRKKRQYKSTLIVTKCFYIV